MPNPGSRMAQIWELFHGKYQDPLELELKETFAGQEGLLYNMLMYQMGWMDENGTAMSGIPWQLIHTKPALISPASRCARLKS